MYELVDLFKVISTFLPPDMLVIGTFSTFDNMWTSTRAAQAEPGGFQSSAGIIKERGQVGAFWDGNWIQVFLVLGKLWQQ